MAAVQRLGRQAAQFIATAADPLAALVDLPGNFPSKAAALSRLGLSKATRTSLASLKRIIPAGRGRAEPCVCACDQDLVAWEVDFAAKVMLTCVIWFKEGRGFRL